MWGKNKENGIWFAPSRHYRLLVGGGDRILYVAWRHFRMRVVKPWGNPK
jgi:hypothetical protein